MNGSNPFISGSSPADALPSESKSTKVLNGAGRFLGKALAFIVTAFISTLQVLWAGIVSVVGFVPAILGLAALVMITLLLWGMGGDRLGQRPPDAGIFGSFGKTEVSQTGVRTYTAPFTGKQFVGIPFAGWSEVTPATTEK